MSTYLLLNNQTVVQSAPGTAQLDASGGVPTAGFNLPFNSNLVTLTGGAGEMVQASAAQSFQVVVTGTSGNVSATVQPIVSNDGYNWMPYGSAITVASGATPQQGSANGSGFWRYFSAYLTAITGTGATAKCVMAA